MEADILITVAASSEDHKALPASILKAISAQLQAHEVRCSEVVAPGKGCAAALSGDTKELEILLAMESVWMPKRAASHITTLGCSGFPRAWWKQLF